MNKVIMQARLATDPELRYTSGNNTPVCSFKIAVNRQFKSDNTTADFFPVTAWNKTAENCSKYLKKGQQIIVVGRLQNRSWEDQENKKHYITEIIMDEFHFCGSKQQEQQQSDVFEQAEYTDDGGDLPF